MRTLVTLDPSEIEAVSGGLPAIQPVKHAPLMAEDMYGNKMDVEDWMRYQSDVLPNYPNPQDGYDPHDFPGGRGQ